MEIHAYAGPMKREEASVFRKKWKTPPRTPGTPGSPAVFSRLKSPLSNLPDRTDNSVLVRLQDTEKGLERVGRDLAKQHQVGWKEYWPFLDTFADLTSEDGLKLLEDYINLLQMNSFSESRSNNLNRSEDEKINGSLNNMSSIISPISDLCKNFEACSLSDNGIKKDYYLQKRKVPVVSQVTQFNETILDALNKSGLSPFLCVEKSCQVFATRISNHLIFFVQNHLANATDALETEIKHLKSLIGSYMSDSRFNIVNFQSVHWRIAQLVTQKIKDMFPYDDEIFSKRAILENIIKTFNKTVDVFSSDDEEFNSYRQPEKIVRRKSTSNNKQVICLVSSILKALDTEQEEEQVNVVNEEDCVKVWSNAMVCSCVWKTVPKSGRKNSYLKKYLKGSSCRATRSFDNVSRRLNFLDEDVSGKYYFDIAQYIFIVLSIILNFFVNELFIVLLILSWTMTTYAIIFVSIYKDKTAYAVLNPLISMSAPVCSQPIALLSV